MKADVATALAHQIRIIRTQRGLTQAALAKQLGTTQAAVSRLEDPSYGKVSLSTLFDLARVFDTGLQVRFVSMVKMLRDTWQPSIAAMQVRSFEEEAPLVGYVDRPTGTKSITIDVQSNTTRRLTSAPPALLYIGGQIAGFSGFVTMNTR